MQIIGKEPTLEIRKVMRSISLIQARIIKNEELLLDPNNPRRNSIRAKYEEDKERLHKKRLEINELWKKVYENV